MVVVIVAVLVQSGGQVQFRLSDFVIVSCGTGIVIVRWCHVEEVII